VLKGHWAIRLPWRRYLSIQLQGRWDHYPVDADAMAREMVLGKRAVDPEFLARMWWKLECDKMSTHQELWKTIRILERKISAQRLEIKRLLKASTIDALDEQRKP
jgi:hypothetical protein